MASDRQLAANKRNACLSSGPRTPAGKLRSRDNAFRHGLATRVGNDPAMADDIERLAKRLAGYSNDFWHSDYARTVAECYLDLRRIRAARTEVLRRVGELEAAAPSEHELAAAAVERINRYERRVLSRRRKALKELISNS